MADTNPNATLTGVTPHLMIPDGRAAEEIDFYAAAFGAREIARSPAQDGKRLMHVHLAVNGGAVLLHDDFPEMNDGKTSPPPSGTVLHLQLADADVAWAKALAAGATVRFPLADQFWGDRYGQVRDPFGHIWSIAGPRQGGQ
jgi:PhnB protein